MSAKALVRDKKVVSHSNIFADHNVLYDRSGKRKRSSFMVRLKKDMVQWRTAASSKRKEVHRRWSRSSSSGDMPMRLESPRGSMASISEEMEER